MKRGAVVFDVCFGRLGLRASARFFFIFILRAQYARVSREREREVVAGRERLRQARKVAAWLSTAARRRCYGAPRFDFCLFVKKIIIQNQIK